MGYRLPTVQSTAQRFSPFRVVAVSDSARLTVDVFRATACPSLCPWKSNGWMDCAFKPHALSWQLLAKGGTVVAGSCAWRSRASRFSFRLMKRLQVHGALRGTIRDWGLARGNILGCRWRF